MHTRLLEMLIEISEGEEVGRRWYEYKSVNDDLENNVKKYIH